jgi:CMP-2-keto-3-deoxyoctulosonic acid synthetase
MRYLQTGLIGLSRSALDLFASTQPGSIELSERIDMLRFIENGESVLAAPINQVSLGVDRPNDITIAEAMLLKDATFPHYRQRNLDF